jgi:hypothetical protein
MIRPFNRENLSLYTLFDWYVSPLLLSSLELAWILLVYWVALISTRGKFVGT